MKRWHKLAALAAGIATLAGAGASARVADAAPSAQAPIQVGVVYSRTGLLAAYGARVRPGPSLRPRVRDEGHERGQRPQDRAHARRRRHRPGQGASPARKDLIGKGYKIITGTASSGIALQLAPLADQNKILYISGPAATDAVTGRQQEHVPRRVASRSRTSSTAGSFLGGGGGKTVTVFAQDSAFGQGNYLAVKALMEDLGGQKVNRILVPLSAQDFTPFAQQVKQQKTDLLFVAWAGHDRARDVARARSAERVRVGRQGRDRSPRAGRRGRGSARRRTASRSSPTTSTTRRRTR